MLALAHYQLQQHQPIAHLVKQQQQQQQQQLQLQLQHMDVCQQVSPKSSSSATSCKRRASLSTLSSSSSSSSLSAPYIASPTKFVDELSSTPSPLHSSSSSSFSSSSFASSSLSSSSLSSSSSSSSSSFTSLSSSSHTRHHHHHNDNDDDDDDGFPTPSLTNPHTSSSSSSSPSSSSSSSSSSGISLTWSDCLNMVCSLLETKWDKNMEKRRNEVVRPTSSSISSFHSSALPSVRVSSYLRRLASLTQCSSATLLFIGCYLVRVHQRCPSLVDDLLAAHRLVLAAFVVAAKFCDDDDTRYRNSCVAKLGGVTTIELNTLERELLTLLTFDLYVDNYTLNNFCYAALAQQQQQQQQQLPQQQLPQQQH